MITRFLRCSLLLTAVLTILATCGDARAIAPDPHEWVKTAIDRMGGEAALRGIRTLRFASAGYRNLLEQSERPEGPWIPSIELMSEDWDLAGSRSNVAGDSVVGEFHFRMRQIVANGIAARSFDGRWGPEQRASIDAMAQRFAWTPFRAALDALDAADLRAESDRLFQGVPHHVVAWTAKDGPTRLLLNAQTGYPTAVEAVRAYPEDLYWQVWGDVAVRTMYSYWSIEAGGVRFPRQWDTARNDLTETAITIQSVEVNPEFPADTFEIPNEARDAFTATQSLDRPAFGSRSRPARDLAPGVVEIPSSWDVTLVKQDDGIVVIEAPISAGYSARVIEEAEKRFPGLPVKAVISTSDSWPHFGGVREYVARGIPMYILDLNQPILSRAIDAPHRLHPDALASKPRRPQWRVVKAKTIIGAGPNRLELYSVRGETGERMMAVYFPQHRILHGSDLVQWGRGGPPEYVSELADLAARERLAVDMVFAMHADPSPWKRVIDAIGGRASALRPLPHLVLESGRATISDRAIKGGAWIIAQWRSGR
jgi:hypothetical protein